MLWIRIDFGQLVPDSYWECRIQIQEGTIYPLKTKVEKHTKFHVFKVLGVLFFGLKAYPAAWTPFKEPRRQIFFQFLTRKNIFFPSIS
jgi:hypothetical protein